MGKEFEVTTLSCTSTRITHSSVNKTKPKVLLESEVAEFSLLLSFFSSSCQDNLIRWMIILALESKLFFLLADAQYQLQKIC